MDACHEFCRKIGPDGKKGQVRRAEAVPYFREKACPGRISGKINSRAVRRAQEKASPQGPVGVSVEWTAAAVMPCGGKSDGVFPIESGSRTLKDAINEALRYWISHQEDTLYCFGTAAGPHPFPTLVRQLQSVIGTEARAQMLERAGRLPDVVVACVGGGSNAIGMLHPFVEDEGVRLVGVEAGGTGEPGCYNSAPINLGSPGVLHGHVTMLLQDQDGQIQPSHSISAGLDYPGVGPEHSHLAEIGRVHYGVICDASALNAFQTLTQEEGIIPALESSHAVAWVLDHADELPAGGDVLVNLSGRGDKDLGIVKKYLNL